MKVYVAAPGVERNKARSVMQLVEAYGHEITFNWLGPDTDIRDHWRDARDEGRIHAEKERQGVKDCKVLILVVPGPRFRKRGLGCYIEFGMAAGQDKTIWIVDYGDWNRDSVFFCLTDVHFLTYEEMNAALRMAKDTEVANEAEARSRVDGTSHLGGNLPSL